MKNGQLDSGFTLLEIMVAIAIIAIALDSVYKMHAQTLSMNYTTRFYTTAPLLAQSKIAELIIKPRDDLAKDAGDFGEDFPNYRWQVAVDDVESEALGRSTEYFKKIDVTIALNNDKSTYSLRTYRFFNNVR